MHIVRVSFTKAEEEVLKHIAEHDRFLDEQCGQGLFLTSGPTIPHDGGVVLVSDVISRQELVTLLQEDPLSKLGLATFEITTFTPTKFRPDFNAKRGS
jgi:uncharacterized protein YciI